MAAMADIGRIYFMRDPVFYRLVVFTFTILIMHISKFKSGTVAQNTSTIGPPTGIKPALAFLEDDNVPISCLGNFRISRNVAVHFIIRKFDLHELRKA